MGPCWVMADALHTYGGTGDPVRIGDIVVLEGLRSATQHNGSRASVTSVGRERVTVARSGGELMKVKPANLKRVSPGSPTVDPAAVASVVAMLDDDLQRRDWMHRGDFDPPESWKALWVVPQTPGSQGEQQSPPCQCGRPTCAHSTPQGCSGRVVTDPCICWHCKHYFNLMCLGGPDQFTNQLTASGGNLGSLPGSGLCVPQGGPDVTSSRAGGELLKQWNRCPKCAAPMGGMGMPSVFRRMLGGVASGHFDFNMSSDLPAITAELDHAMAEADRCRKANEHEGAILFYTHVINAANMIRSAHADAFTLGVIDNFIKAHQLRAKLEGNKALYRRLKDAFPNFQRRDKTAGPSPVSHSGRQRLWAKFPGSNTDDAFQGCFVRGEGDDGSHCLTLDGQYRFLRRTGHDTRAEQREFRHRDDRILPPKTRVNCFQGAQKNWEWTNQMGCQDHEFLQLDHEWRGANHWAYYGKVPQATTMMDLRWSFHTVDAAKDFFKLSLLVKHAETSSQNAPPGYVSTMHWRDVAMDGLRSEDQSAMTHGEQGTANTTAISTAFLFRCGRVCGKVFVSVTETGNDRKRYLSSSANHFQARLKLFSQALANTYRQLDMSVDRDGNPVTSSSGPSAAVATPSDIDGGGSRGRTREEKSEQVAAERDRGASPESTGPERRKSCSQCGSTTRQDGTGGKLFKCACRTVLYCSKECQKQSWKEGHKAVCSAAPNKKK